MRRVLTILLVIMGLTIMLAGAASAAPACGRNHTCNVCGKPVVHEEVWHEGAATYCDVSCPYCGYEGLIATNPTWKRLAELFPNIVVE